MRLTPTAQTSVAHLDSTPAVRAVRLPLLQTPFDSRRLPQISLEVQSFTGSELTQSSDSKGRPFYIGTPSACHPPTDERLDQRYRADRQSSYVSSTAE